MRLVWDQGEDVAAWVAGQIPWMPETGFGPSAAIGVVSEAGEPLGGVVYSNWQPAFRTVDLTGASRSRRWLTRRLAHLILAYPFRQLGCERITAVTQRHAKGARDALEKLGFKREGSHPMGFGPGTVAITYGLLRADWERGPFGRPDREKPERVPAGFTLAADASLTPPAGDKPDGAPHLEEPHLGQERPAAAAAA